MGLIIAAAGGYIGGVLTALYFPRAWGYLVRRAGKAIDDVDIGTGTGL